MASKLRLKLKALQASLQETHPDLFDLISPVPLKIGISGDVRAFFPDEKPGLIHALLGWLTSRRAYLRACAPNAPRYDFAGLTDQTVSPSQAAFAASRLQQREAKAAEINAERARKATEKQNPAQREPRILRV